MYLTLASGTAPRISPWGEGGRFSEKGPKQHGGPNFLKYRQYYAIGCAISNIFVSDKALPLIFLVSGFIEAQWHCSFFAASKIRAAPA